MLGLLETLIEATFGSVGSVQSAGTIVSTKTAPPAGRYSVWAMGRHTADDGLRLVVGGTTKAVLASAAGSVKLDKMNVDVNGSQDISIALNVTTGALGSASATLFIMRQCDHLSTHVC